jgi:hypothetical protein
MSIESKYDLKKLHADCLAWWENPTFKPWMNEIGINVSRGVTRAIIESRTKCFASMSRSHDENAFEVFEFAHFIGLDIEAYRFPKMTYKEAVERYLASVPEGGELIPGWRKEADEDWSVWAVNDATKHEVYHPVHSDYKTAYYFLRLDLKEGFEVEVQP